MKRTDNGELSTTYFLRLEEEYEEPGIIYSRVHRLDPIKGQQAAKWWLPCIKELELAVESWDGAKAAIRKVLEWTERFRIIFRELDAGLLEDPGFESLTEELDSCLQITSVSIEVKGGSVTAPIWLGESVAELTVGGIGKDTLKLLCRPDTCDLSIHFKSSSLSRDLLTDSLRLKELKLDQIDLGPVLNGVTELNIEYLKMSFCTLGTAIQHSIRCTAKKVWIDDSMDIFQLLDFPSGVKDAYIGGTHWRFARQRLNWFPMYGDSEDDQNFALAYRADALILQKLETMPQLEHLQMGQVEWNWRDKDDKFLSVFYKLKQLKTLYFGSVGSSDEDMHRRANHMLGDLATHLPYLERVEFSHLNVDLDSDDNAVPCVSMMYALSDLEILKHEVEAIPYLPQLSEPHPEREPTKQPHIPPYLRMI
ncbi:hypothetical protein TRICI_001708 [Trichomonascus ciferrii]|uniref:Uncharacterized protein n=1 Tax=Trichomonascus ciferrii TaxID=44093 RepID=A0A642VCF6_9ASCO|nr:hypothetical protein TRICI_001708 [Trichomonascus ciferrii]